MLDVADLLGEGANTLRILHIEPGIPQALVLEDIALVQRPEPLPEAESEIGKPAPTGELPLIAPRIPEPVDSIEPTAAGGFAIVAGESRMSVRSAFTWPTRAGTCSRRRPARSRRPAGRPWAWRAEAAE